MMLALDEIREEPIVISGRYHNIVLYIAYTGQVSGLLGRGHVSADAIGGGWLGWYLVRLVYIRHEGHSWAEALCRAKCLIGDRQS